MNTYAKWGTAFVAVLVIAGGGYYFMTPRATNELASAPSMAGTGTENPATASTPAPAAANDSFDDFALAMESDIAAQKAAVASTDQSASAAALSANTVTTSGQPYDPSSL
jgi:hypothetical protein